MRFQLVNGISNPWESPSDESVFRVTIPYRGSSLFRDIIFIHLLSCKSQGVHCPFERKNYFLSTACV